MKAINMVMKGIAVLLKQFLCHEGTCIVYTSPDESVMHHFQKVCFVKVRAEQ